MSFPQNLPYKLLLLNNIPLVQFKFEDKPEYKEAVNHPVKNEIDEIGPLQEVGMRMKDEEPFS
jgi:hypothetical protein